MTTDAKPMGVAQLVELADDSWVNSGFTACVFTIERKVATRTNKPFWVCELRDVTGSATVELAMFTAPKFTEGQQVEFTGQGIKFKNGQYGPKVTVGDKTEIRIVGTSAHHEEQKERAASGQPAVNGALQPIHGASVGAAVKIAWEARTGGLDHAELGALLDLPAFWRELYVTASDVIRVHQMLEHGKLAPPVRERLAKTPDPRPAKPAPDYAPATQKELDEDVPF